MCCDWDLYFLAVTLFSAWLGLLCPVYEKYPVQDFKTCLGWNHCFVKPWQGHWSPVQRECNTENDWTHPHKNTLEMPQHTYKHGESQIVMLMRLVIAVCMIDQISLFAIVCPEPTSWESEAGLHNAVRCPHVQTVCH